MIKNRDVVIDLFKGFTIIWIIHIHTVFWSGRLYLPDVIRQLSLFIDIPIYFFISGYLIFTGSGKSILQRCFRQFKRLYIRYLVLALLVFSSIFLLRVFFRKSLPHFSDHLINILLVEANFGELKGFAMNLWFLRTYLLIIIVMPIFAFWRESLFRNICISILFLCSFLVFSVNSSDPIGEGDAVYAAFYGIFFLLGATFRLIEKKIKLYSFLISCAFLFCFIWLVIHQMDYTVMIQPHKFPPSLRYFLFSLPYICIFILFKSFIPKALIKLPALIEKGLLWSSREIFEIYLIQSLVCSLPYYFVPMLKDSASPFILYIVILTFNLTLTIFCVWLYKHFRLFYSYLFSHLVLSKRSYKI